MAEMNSLINRRGIIKGQITRILSYTQGEKINIEINQIKNRHDRLKELFEAFEEVQSSIEEDTGLTDDSEKYRAEVEELYYITKANCDKIIKEEEPLGNNNHTRSNGENFNNSTADSNQVPSLNSSFTPAVKLAALKIPKFTGSYAEWATFCDIFTALVHNNDTLTEIQKFFYLRSSLGGEAEKSLRCLETSAENYKTAWQTLISRYNNKKVLIQNHTRALYNLAAVTSETAIPLRQLIDGVNGHINALQMLGQQPKAWGSLLIHLITTKLDKGSLREWETVSQKNEISSVENLLEFLQNRFLVLEAIESSNGSNAQSVINTVPKKWPNRASVHVSTNEIKCFNCSGGHTIYRCPSFLALSINDRVKKINDLKLCKICLRSHPNIKCQSRRCAKCSRSHNSLLHYIKASNSENNTAAESTTTSNSRLSDQSNASASQTTSLNVHAARIETSESVLLATAVVKVYNTDKNSITCRVLLDTGSQNNFMTEEVCQLLKLQRTPISCSITGIGQSSQKSSYAVNATLESLVSDYKSTFEFLVLPKLTSRIPLTRVDTSCIKIPKNITLADPQYYKPQKIDIILGATVFFELLGNGRFQPIEKGVFFQETHFGYIISGQVSNTTNRFNGSIMSFVANSSQDDMLRLEEKISKFWRSEEILPEESFSLEEKLCQRHFDNTVKRDQDGRFTVSLPFRDSVANLGESKDIAMRRFLAIERRLNANKSLKDDYVKFMDEYQSSGHMSPVKNIRC